MKRLSNYVEAAQTALFNKTGTFFAFSNKQFEDGKKEGVIYVSLGAGLICPKENVSTLTEGLKSIQAAGMAQDIAENSKDGVIRRELFNYEAFYTWDISDTVDALADYGITQDEVQAVFDRISPTVEA